MSKKSKMTEEDRKVYTDFELCGQNAKKWMNKCVIMLPEIERRRIWEKKGFSCIYEFAAKLAGMSRNKVNEGLRVMARTEGLAELRKVVEKKGIWAVRPVLRVVNEENQKFWAQKSMEMNKGVLETYVRDFERDRNECGDKDGEIIFGDGLLENGHPGVAKNGGKPGGKPNQLSKIEIKVSAEIAEKLMEVKGDDSWEDLMKELIELKQQKEEKREKENQYELKKIREEIEGEKHERSGAKGVDKRMNRRLHNPVSRHIPVKIQRYVKLRARGKCEAPGCRRAGAEMHHTYPFALRREHDPDKIRLLCEDHHQLAHQGLIDDDGPPERWKWLKKPNVLDFKNVINQRVFEYKRAPT